MLEDDLLQMSRSLMVIVSQVFYSFLSMAKDNYLTMRFQTLGPANLFFKFYFTFSLHFESFEAFHSDAKKKPQNIIFVWC